MTNRAPLRSPLAAVGAGSGDGGRSVNCTAGRSRGFGGRAPAPLDTANQLLPREGETHQEVCRHRATHGPGNGSCTGEDAYAHHPVARPHRSMVRAACNGSPMHANCCRRRRPARGLGRWCRDRVAAWRHRYGRPRRMTWRAYATQTADALASLGYGALASRLRRCGSWSTVHTCNACGDPAASVRIHAGCNVRACPWCARRESHQRAAQVKGAVARVPGFVDTRRDAHLAELEARAAELDAARASPHRAANRARVRRAIHGTRAAQVGRAGWSWKLITVSPAWDPSDAASYSVAGLQRRLDDLRARWRALWDAGLSVEGLAAAYWRVEISAKGHVHCHALYFGPWQSDEWCAAQVGCFVDVREVEAGADGTVDDAVREAVKYALKSPTATRAAWVAGLDPSTTVHPELAARWVVATRHRRLAEPYGTMRDAMRAAEECDAPESTQHGCASCGSLDLDGGRSMRTVAIARELGAREQWTFTARSVRLGGVPFALPARVSIERVGPERAP